MMKKIIKTSMKIFMVILLISIIIVDSMPVTAVAATTLRDLKNELAALVQEKTTSENQVNSTEAQINANNKEIAEAYTAIEEAKNNIIISEKKIEETNEEIENLSVIAAELLVMYEQMQNQDTYMSFVTASSSLTELIMRLDAITMLTDYNEQTILTLENLIIENEKEQVLLVKTQEELKGNIATYESKIVSLQGDLKYFAEITEDIDDQINNQQKLIEYYEDLGCGLDQNLDECVEIANNVSWMKPLNYGIVTSLFGYRYIWGSYSFHNGIDIGGNAEGTKVYSIAAGTVAAITERSSCGGNKVYVHSYVDGKAYTAAYLHLLNINVKVGDKVTTDTVVGTIGGGSGTWWDTCTTGAHLHLTIATGFYLGGGSDSYSNYYTYVANSIEPPGFPGLYNSFSSRTAWFS
ncbi:MAG: peptidoglycan DD-metalloendopeptidase family protein [bacterium]